MFDRLEQVRSLTGNPIKIIAAAIIGEQRDGGVPGPVRVRR